MRGGKKRCAELGEANHENGSGNSDIPRVGPLAPHGGISKHRGTEITEFFRILVSLFFVPLCFTSSESLVRESGFSIIAGQ